MLSIHTLEISKEVDRDIFYKCRNQVKDRKKFDKSTGKDYSNVDDGITVWFPKTEYKKKIKLIVNPSRLLGQDDVVSLWKPSSKNISKMLVRLEEHIEEYFGSEYELNDFNLTRIDFTKNVCLDDRDKVAAYIKIFYNIRKVKGFSPKYGKYDEWYDRDLGFDLKGKCNGIEFTAYDKAAAIEKNMENMTFRQKEMKERMESAKGVLRLEVKLTTQKAICKYTDENETVKRIIDLAEKCEEVFMDTFVTVVPYGDFYQKDKVVKIINENVTNKPLKKKMLKLLELIPKKKSLYLAKKELNDRQIDRILEEFYKHNVSPVTISKTNNMKHLKTLYAFL